MWSGTIKSIECSWLSSKSQIFWKNLLFNCTPLNELYLRNLMTLFLFSTWSWGLASLTHAALPLTVTTDPSFPRKDSLLHRRFVARSVPSSYPRIQTHSSSPPDKLFLRIIPRKLEFFATISRNYLLATKKWRATIYQLVSSFFEFSVSSQWRRHKSPHQVNCILWWKAWNCKVQ